MGPNDCFEVGYFSGRTRIEVAAGGGGGVSRTAAGVSWRRVSRQARGFSWHCTSGPSAHLIYTSYLAVATLGRTHGHRNLHLRTLYNKPIDTKLRIESPRRLQQISRLVVFFFFFFSIILYTYSIINPVHKLFHWFILEIADHNTHVLYVLHTGTLR